MLGINLQAFASVIEGYWPADLPNALMSRSVESAERRASSYVINLTGSFLVHPACPNIVVIHSLGPMVSHIVWT